MLLLLSSSKMAIIQLSRPSVNYAKDWLDHSSILVVAGLEEFLFGVIPRGQSTTTFLCFGPFSGTVTPNQLNNREKAVFGNIFMNNNLVIFIFHIVFVASSGSPRGGKSRRY